MRKSTLTKQSESSHLLDTETVIQIDEKEKTGEEDKTSGKLTVSEKFEWQPKMNILDPWMLIIENLTLSREKFALRATCRWMHHHLNIPLTQKEQHKKNNYENVKRELDFYQDFADRQGMVVHCTAFINYVAYPFVVTGWIGGVTGGMIALLFDKNNPDRDEHLFKTVVSSFGGIPGAIFGALSDYNCFGPRWLERDSFCNLVPSLLSYSLGPFYNGITGCIVGAGVGIASAYAGTAAYANLSDFPAFLASAGTVAIISAGSFLTGLTLFKSANSIEVQAKTKRTEALEHITSVKRNFGL